MSSEDAGMVHDSPVTLSGSMEPDFKVGEWWVRPQRNELEHGDTVEHVEARSMAVLVCLAADAPRVVSKKKLLQQVWGESVFVGDEVISHAIWDLRRALGDSAKSPSFIQTVPRKGYRLLQEVLRLQGSALPAVGARIDHYEIEEELGHGSMGVVFRARDCRLDRSVAIKFLAQELTRDLSANQRFRREASLAASLDHPHLAAVHDIGATVGGQQYIVMPFYAGGSLKQRLAQGPVPVKEAVELGRQLASGLAAAHRRDIIHRDIKPANILLDEHGTPKISDFGIAKLLGGTDLTRTGASLGTPAYKSPEQSRGEPVDHRSDIWSLGVVLFELLTGRRPFDGEFDQAVVHSILSKDPEPLEDATGQPIPEAVREVVCKAMAKEPGERYQGAGELEAALSALSEASLDSGSSRHSARTSKKRSPFRWRPAAVGIGVLAVVALMVVWLGWRPLEVSPAATEASETVFPLKAKKHLDQAHRTWLEGKEPRIRSAVERHLEAARRLAPGNSKVLNSYAHFYVEAYAIDRSRESFQLAEQAVEEALAASPLSGAALSAQARLELVGGNFEKAENLARDAIALEPECGMEGLCDIAYAVLGEAQFFLDDPDWITTLERGTQVGQGHVRANLRFAVLLERDGDRDRAAAVYGEILRFDEDQTTALNDLGYLYNRRGNYFEATPLFETLYRKRQDALSGLNLGVAYYGTKLWDEALRVFLEAFQLSVDAGEPMPDLAVAIGDTYLELEDLEKAASWFQKGLDLLDRNLAGQEANHAETLGQRATCLAKLGHFEQAWEQFQAIRDRAEKYPDIWAYAARIAALEKDTERLFDLARRAIEGGVEPARLLDDPAFKPYRSNDAYKKLLAP